MIKNILKDRKAIEMGFNWIFAIIAGTFILFLAIYGASRFIETSESSLYTQSAAKLVSLFDPLETGLASGKSSEIDFKKQTKLYFDCEERAYPPFGKQTISFTEKTFGDEYGEKGGDITIKNKYVFSEEIVEGKKLHIFSKPFFMPFKIADIIIISSENYCFYDSPEYIREDLEGLNLENIYFINFSMDCSGKKVCFDGDCEISVVENENFVLKDEQKLYYEGDLIYSAIFSEIYECNIKRLMNKFYELGKIYLDKTEIIGRKECINNIGPKLANLMKDSKNLQSSEGLNNLFKDSLEIESINGDARSGCRLY